ncbi:MAG: NAD(+) diphosphatase [Pseudomonadota bacterium]
MAEPFKPTVRTTTRLFRHSEHRPNKEWISERLGDHASRFFILSDLKPLIVSDEERTKATLRWFSAAELGELGLPTSEALFLGTDENDAAHFCVPLPEHMVKYPPGGGMPLRPIVDLRSLATQGVLEAEELSLAGQARSLANWHLDNRHCGYCGGKTNLRDGGWKRKCWVCGKEHFPRTDPVVIMLITDGERCILAHEKRYVEGMWSTLAGFIEHGEDIEHAVRRETREETNIEVGEVRYLASQPWPFPHSLMIGCIGYAKTTEITIDPVEIDEARWFTKDEARQMAEGTHPDNIFIPGQQAIARQLVMAFLNGET